jgi:hypothetical protein
MTDLSFEITGPDDDGFVWLHSGDATINLGTEEQATEIMSQWLAQRDEEHWGQPATDDRPS